jgi:hypothetical protein
MFRRVCAVLCFLVSCNGFAQMLEPLAESSNDIGYASPSAALEALRKKPGVSIREENDWIVVNDPSEHAFWSIATANNHYYPSAVKRMLVKQNGAIHLQMRVMCGADKITCDNLVRQFQAINAQISNSFHKQS